jgi:hypothetical protein
MRKPKLTPDEFLAQIDTSPDASLTSTETEPVDEMDEVDEIDPLGDEDQDDDDAIEEPDDAIVAAVEPDPEPDAQEPVAAFAYTPSLPADVFTADENAYIRNCEDSTDPELRIKGRQF